MKLLLKNALIVDQDSTFNGKKRDILIEKGKIVKIDATIKLDKVKTYDAKGACVSPGFIDLNCSIYEPGFEYREDMKSGLNAALNGGFTSIALMPNTEPCMDNAAQISHIKRISQSSITRVMPIGAVSKGLKGEHLAEIYDMHASGAIAFSDGYKSIQDAGLLERALLYIKKFGGVVLNHPEDVNLALEGKLNEGVISNRLGLQGAPALAEELMVARDIYLCEHTNSRLHITNISTAKSVALVKEAKSKGINVTVGVNAYSLLLNEEHIKDYDTNMKVRPHLRTEKDRKALLKGLKSGVIDVISSGHNPCHQDEKKVEFDNARFGMSALDSAFSVAVEALSGQLTPSELAAKFGANPASILGFKNASIEKDGLAVLTVYNLDKTTHYSKENIKSKSKHTPFLNQELKGKIQGIVNKTKTNLL